MLYNITLDEQKPENISIIIRLPGEKAHVLHMSFCSHDSEISAQTNSITGEYTLKPLLPITDLLDCQTSLANLINHLVANNVATYAGKYIKGKKTIPVFRSETTNGLYVDSVDKKTGQRLLKGVHLKNPDKVKKLANWIIGKFPQVSAWAEVNYNTAQKTTDELAYIIMMAERTLLTQSNARLSLHE